MTISDELSVTPAGRWCDEPGAVRRFVIDLIVDEVARLRPGGAGLPGRHWADELHVDERGVGLDSLERLTVAAAVSEVLHLQECGLEEAFLGGCQLGEWLNLVRGALESRGALQNHQEQITFCTSGSTGTPKRCLHGLADLEEESAFWARMLGGTRRVLAAVPAHHIYGFLFTILLPRYWGRCPVIDARQMTPQSLGRILCAGDLIVSHPAHWALMARHIENFAPQVAGVTSSAPCPAELAAELTGRGLACLHQVYGSSETAGIGWRTTPDSPYQLMPHWSRHAEDDAMLWRHASGPTPRLHHLADRLLWHPDGSFFVGERVDAAVQVAGINVHPALVRRVLIDHPLVADAVVRLMTPREGDRLKAYVVPVPGSDAAGLPGELMRWSAMRLSTAERPKSFTIGRSLPMNDRGKLTDWPISA
jgi:4-coumarate--CoA ligase (photoactive yellow protein activation family)